MARSDRARKSNAPSYWKTSLPFGKTNWMLFGAGFLTLILGYVALSSGKWDSWMSLNLAPVLLVLAYCVIFPLAILYQKREKTEEE